MIYIVKHKEYNNPVPKGFKEIGVGSLFDGKGENINELNPYINEATAYYDLWKNSKDKVIGIAHYRRLFAENGEPVTTKRVTEILKDNDIIVAHPYNVGTSLYNSLRGELAPGIEIGLFYKYLCLIYDQEPGFKEYMENAREFYPREMIIAKRDTFDKFCKAVFRMIIPLAEQYHKEDSDSKTNPRLVGFITERYMSYWIENSGLKTYEMDFMEA